MVAKPPGKPTSDVSLLCRNRLWAWMVFNTRPYRTWDGLDTYWLEKIDQNPTEGHSPDNRGRRRVFFRIFHQATDPASTKGLGGSTLLEKVSESGEHPDATALYESKLWRLVGPEPLTPAQVLAMHQELIKSIGLFQASAEEVLVASTVGVVHWAFSNRNLEHVRIAAARIARRGTADAIALLGCCFQRALDHLALREADIYLAAIVRAYRKLYHQWMMQPEVATSLSTLIDVRLIRRWHVPIDPQLVGFRVRRRKRSAPFVADVPSDPSLLENRMRREPPMFQPVVAFDQTLQDFRANYPRLHEQAMQRMVEALETAHGPVDDTDLPRARKALARHFLGDGSSRKTP